jgi:hypothetical protein
VGTEPTIEVLTEAELRELDGLNKRALRMIRRRRCEEFAPIVAEPDLALRMDELIEVALITKGMKAERQSVRKALARIGQAEGAHAAHAAWQELAAAALLMADSVRPRHVPRD